MFLWITNTSHVSWKYWAMMDYGKIKKCPDEIRCLDWITLLDRYWLVINDWLADIDWPDHLTCSSYSVRRETPWEDLVNKGSKVTHSTISATLYSWQWVKMYHIFDEQIMITLVTFYAPGCLLVLCECEWILDLLDWILHLFQEPPYSLLL